jgi:predicted phosphodiesterase
MRVILFSDVHAIPHALSALLRQIAIDDVIWFLGDLLGYGPFPKDTLTTMMHLMQRNRQNICLLGNHDEAIATWKPEEQGREFRIEDRVFSADPFQPHARQIINQHGDLLYTSAPAQMGWLRQLKPTAIPVDFPKVFLAHGKYDPDNNSKALWTYATKTIDLASAYLTELRQHQPVRLFAVGHRHVPALFQWDATEQHLKRYQPFDQKWYHFDHLDDEPLILNPGSLSLPRLEGVSTSAYVILETDDAFASARVGFRKLAYDWRPLLAVMNSNYPGATILRNQMMSCPLPPGITYEEGA